MIAVVAGSFREFDNYCKEKGLDPKDHRRVLFVSSTTVLRGMQHYQLTFVGTWATRNDIEEIKAIYRMHQREERQTTA